MPIQPKNKNDKNKDQIPAEPADPDRNNDGGETYGQEPPVRDPKDSPQPDRYEV